MKSTYVYTHNGEISYTNPTKAIIKEISWETYILSLHLKKLFGLLSVYKAMWPVAACAQGANQGFKHIISFAICLMHI